MVPIGKGRKAPDHEIAVVWLSCVSDNGRGNVERRDGGRAPKCRTFTFVAYAEHAKQYTLTDLCSQNRKTSNS